MTNAPLNRKTHVIRMLGTNKNGDVLQDMKLDIERMDIAKSVYETAESNWQGLQRLLKWFDDPDAADYNPDGAPSRKVDIVKVCLPDEPDQSDPEEFWKVPVIKGARLQRADQGKQIRLINDELTQARIVKARRILHYDTNIDDKAQAAFDADPTRTAFVVPGDQYSRDDTTKDDSQWIEHEVITFLKGRGSGQTKTGQGDDQGKQTKLLNKYLIDESEDLDPSAYPAGYTEGPDGCNPPWRLDPYQNIINLQFKKIDEKIAVFAGNPASASAMWFRVDPDSHQPVRFASKLVFSGNGQQQSFAPVDNLIQSTSDRGANIVKVDDKGNAQFSARVLFDLSGAATGIPPDAFFDNKPASIAALPDVPAKGKAVGGVNVTNSSITKYDGDNIVWTLTDLSVLELFTGRDGPGTITVLGEGPDSDVDQEVFVVDVASGGVISRRTIDFGLDPVENSETRIEWDTSSNGDTYVVFFSGVKAFDIDGGLKWTYLFDPDASFSTSSQHSIAVIEDTKKNAFCLISDFSQEYGDRTDGFSEPPFGFKDHFIRILDAGGSELGQVAWGTSEDGYITNPGDELIIFETGIDRSILELAHSTSRFPAPP